MRNLYGPRSKLPQSRRRVRYTVLWVWYIDITFHLHCRGWVSCVCALPRYVTYVTNMCTYMCKCTYTHVCIQYMITFKNIDFFIRCYKWYFTFFSFVNLYPHSCTLFYSFSNSYYLPYSRPLSSLLVFSFPVSSFLFPFSPLYSSLLYSTLLFSSFLFTSLISSFFLLNSSTEG